MNKLIIVILLILALPSIAAAEDLSYVVVMKFDGSSFTPESLDLAAGSAPDIILQPEDGYIAKVISFSEKELYLFKFTASLHVYDAPFQPEEKFIQLIFPHFDNAEMLEIYSPDNKKLMLSIDLSDYSICNEDEVCDASEDLEHCASDCTEETVTEDSVAEDISVEEEREQEEYQTSWVYIIPIIIALIIALILIIKARKSR